MRMSIATDYALRCLLYLTASDDDWTSAAAIAERFDVSTHHLRTVCKTLVAQGWVEGRRGSGGGLRLALEPTELSVGRVVRELEPMDLVECFDAERNTCALDPSCKLKRALRKASAAFLAVLDDITLADLARDRGLLQLVRTG